jgi:hypothetical protein
MKGSEFLAKINEALGVKLPEDVIGKLNEVEFPDELQTKFSEVYISRERAKNDEDIINHVVKTERKNIFDAVDKKLEPFYDLLGDDHKNVLKNTFQTFQKLDMLNTGLHESFKGAKKVTDQDVRKVEDEWAGKLKAKEEQHAKDLQAQEQKFKDVQFEYVVKSKLLGYNISEQFQNVKEHLTQMAIIDLKQQPYLYEIENGSVVIRQEKDGIKRDAFEPGTEAKLTLEKMLDKFVDPFVKKNNSTDTKKEETKKEGEDKQQRTSTEGMTYRDRQWAN